MKHVNCIKKVVALLLTIVLCCGTGIDAMALENDQSGQNGQRSLGLSEEQLDYLNESIMPREPAPSLSSIRITDLTVDEKNEIHIEVRTMGTAKWVLCWLNGVQCEENYNESVVIPSNGTIIGRYRYFHTGMYYSDEMSGRRFMIQAEAQNAMSPWNILSTSNTFTIP